MKAMKNPRQCTTNFFLLLWLCALFIPPSDQISVSIWQSSRKPQSSIVDETLATTNQPVDKSVISEAPTSRNLTKRQVEPSQPDGQQEATVEALNYWCRINKELDHSVEDSNEIQVHLELFHELFDSSAGLVAKLPYSVRIRHETTREYVYHLEVNHGRLLPSGSRSQLCDNEQGSDHLRIAFTTAPINITWTVETTPEVPVSTKFTLVTYAADSMRIVSKTSINRFILPGCYLKILRSQGTISSSHFLTQTHDNNEIPQTKVNHNKNNLLACTLVLSVPSAAHTVEINLRKMKLSRSHRDCFADNVIQLGSIDEPFNFSSASWYRTLDDEPSLNVARNYCGKVQDYSKEERWWKSSSVSLAFIRLRSRGHHQGSNFFSLKYNVLGPCSGGLFTQRQGQMELTEEDLMTNRAQDECSFRIHLAYGYKVQLRVSVWPTEQSDSPEEKGQESNKLALSGHRADGDAAQSAHSQGAVGDEDTVLSLESGRCLVMVQMEDATGKHSRCLSLSEQRSSALFTSQTNFVTFRAIRIQTGHRKGSNGRHSETNGTNDFSDGQRNDVTGPSSSSRDAMDQSIKLTVQFTSIPEASLTDGCEPDWIASDEQTCILVHDDPPLGWHQAETKCNQLGAHLVAISSSFVQQVVDTAITNSPLYEPSRSYWIGASDLKQETAFEWSNGKPVTFTKWFPGWPVYQGYNSQPSDDGFSSQDCVEIRQSFGQPGRTDFMADGMYWNDRDCSVVNPFVCQKPRNSGIATTADVMDCNRTQELNRLRPSVIIHSPRYPLSYPESAACTTHLVVPAGYSILLHFDHFDLEDEEDCNYDYVELVEPPGASVLGTGSNGSQQPTPWKRCGNWNSRLKLLRWRSVANRVDIRFNSDGSYGGHGFQLTATIEKTDLNCPESRSISHQGHCYLIVPYPEIGWTAANEICKSIQAELVIADSVEELHYLASQLHSSDQLNSTAFYWIGQVGRFQLSVVHSASDPVHHCPVLRTGSLLGNTSLEPCQLSAGYICETLTAKSNNGGMRNSTIESREGQVKTPNYPLSYSNDAHFRLHIKATNTSMDSERLVIRFKHIDMEYQENCLYDYVALQAYEDGPVTKLCGHHTTNMDRWDFVSETAQVWLTFQSDYSITGSGFHAVWSTISLPGCPHQVIEQPASGRIQSPHFPHYYLPHLNCTLRLLAPDNMRISLEFQVLDVGHSHPSSVSAGSCFQDYVRVAIDGTTSVNLCGSHNTSTAKKSSLRYLSNENQMDVQLVSRGGKQGRGYQASYRFETVPTLIRDIVSIGDEEKLEISQLNYPMRMPLNVSHQLAIVAPHGSFLSFESKTLKPCPSVNGAAVRVLLTDVHNASYPLQLCSGSSDSHYTYESVFHTLELTYEQVTEGVPIILGRIRALRDGNYTAKVSGWSDHSPVEACDLQPCQNDGVCTTNNSLHYCQCRGKWRGLFCSLTLCQMSLCLHGTCTSVNDTQMCVCESGFTGSLCDTPVSACDLDPCQGRGDCFNTENGFHCQCHAWWQGPRCETRWLQIPYKPLSQRMFEEPFWLGLMTMAVVLVIIGFVWCIKRHFAEKLERFVTEELERGKLVNDHGSPMGDWRRGRNTRSSLEPMLQAGVHAFSRPNSPQSTSLNIPNADVNSQRNFLGFRKPSLLSITSLLSPCQISNVASPGTRRDTGRTFSLDDLFRSPRRSPSPASGKRSSDNDVASSQRRDTERQQILQRLVASHVPRTSGNRTSDNLLMTSLTADGKAVVGRHSLTGDEQSTDTDTIMETIIGPSVTSQLDLKAEKRVTFARMLDLVSMELHSSSETDISAGEEAASIRSTGRDQKLANQTEPRHPPRRKARNWSSRRFWRTPNSNSSTQGSASDHDFEQTIPAIVHNEPKAASCASATSQRRSNRLLRLPARTTTDRQSSSTESLLTIIRNLSGTHKTPSTPSSPQISDYELSSSFPTPISTPGSPAGSLETLPSASGANNDNTHSIQVTVIDPSSMSRSSRSSGSNLSTPHITLEIPTPNYGYYLSPIHEVPTPLPSPSHTPLPSLKRQNAVPTSESSSGSPQMKRHTDSDMSVSDETATTSTTMERPRVPLITICSEDGISVQVPTSSKQAEMKVSTLPSSAPPSAPSSAPASPSLIKSKPPPLNIINSNFTRFEKLQRSMEQAAIVNPPPVISVTPVVPVFCISEPSPEDSPSKCNPCLNWERINIGSPPIRKNRDNPGSFINEGPARRILKDTADKSSSLDLPAAPPMITITANFSEVESDTDTGLLGPGGINGQNKMCYLSPFACYGVRQDIGASESNLSSSGYSSMASPGPSPSCSSKTLSVLEGDDIHLSRQVRRRGRDRPMLHRALSPSLESSSPPPDSPPVKNKNLFLIRSIHGTDSDVTDDQMMMAEPVEHESTADYDDSNDEGIDVDHIREKIDTGELKSARELETFISIEMMKPEQTDIDLKFLNVSNRVQKSRSLDSKLKGERQNKLKSDSLDTKLLSLQQNEGTFKFHVQSLLMPESMTTSWMPQGADSAVNDDTKKSPVSSRSESPLSDAKSAGFGRFSAQFYGMSRPDLPYTDSDGLYDYPSSEAVLPVANVNRRNSRKCDRRRERKASLQLGRAEHDGASHGRKISLLEPETERIPSRLQSNKRRIRAHSHLDFYASSSSNESLSTSHRRSPRRMTNRRRFESSTRRISPSSPICDVILTIQAASSAEESQSDEVSYGRSSQQFFSSSKNDVRILRLPSRSRHTGRLLSSRIWRRQDSGSKRREHTSHLKNRRPVNCDSSPPAESSALARRDSFSSCLSDSECNDSNESLANLAEIDDSTDSPIEAKQNRRT